MTQSTNRPAPRTPPAGRDAASGAQTVRRARTLGAQSRGHPPREQCARHREVDRDLNHPLPAPAPARDRRPIREQRCQRHSDQASQLATTTARRQPVAEPAIAPPCQRPVALLDRWTRGAVGQVIGYLVEVVVTFTATDPVTSRTGRCSVEEGDAPDRHNTFGRSQVRGEAARRLPPRANTLPNSRHGTRRWVNPSRRPADRRVAALPRGRLRPPLPSQLEHVYVVFPAEGLMSIAMPRPCRRRLPDRQRRASGVTAGPGAALCAGRPVDAGARHQLRLRQSPRPVPSTHPIGCSRDPRWSPAPAPAVPRSTRRSGSSSRWARHSILDAVRVAGRSVVRRVSWDPHRNSGRPSGEQLERRRVRVVGEPGHEPGAASST